MADFRFRGEASRQSESVARRGVLLPHIVRQVCGLQLPLRFEPGGRYLSRGAGTTGRAATVAALTAPEPPRPPPCKGGGTG
jgi:hypothetical protein